MFHTLLRRKEGGKEGRKEKRKKEESITCALK